jgi:hypothetical protein
VIQLKPSRCSIPDAGHRSVAEESPRTCAPRL